MRPSPKNDRPRRLAALLAPWLALAGGCGQGAAPPPAAAEPKWTPSQELSFASGQGVDVQIDRVPARFTLESPEVCLLSMVVPGAMTASAVRIGGPQKIAIAIDRPGKYGLRGTIPRGSVIRVETQAKAGE